MNDGDSHANIPVKQYAAYIQDDWRVTDRLTLNLGLRYDLVKGLQFDQSKNPNYVLAQQLGAAGRFANVVGYENFGKSPKDDTNNCQPRLGGVWDVRGNAKDLVRAGWGIYTDFGYTNSNVLFPAADASGSQFGTVFTASNTAGLRNPDGSFYQVGQPLTNLASQNEAGGLPLFGQWVDPRLEQPETMQSSVGWSHELAANTVVTADYVHIDGKNLNIRPRLNTADRRRRAAVRRHRVQPELLGHARGDQPRQVGVRRADPRRPAPALARRRLHRLLHAVEGREHDRHGRRRARHALRPRRDQPVRRSADARSRTAAPTRGTGSRRAPRCSCRRASGSRRSSSIARRCRSTRVKAWT